MILSAHQPTFMPWLGLFHKINNSDLFVIFDIVQYLPKEWMNRNYIRSKNDKILLTVPVYRSGFLKKKINDIKIDYSTNWNEKHLKSIKLCYQNKEYFYLYFHQIEEIYNKRHKLLSDLNYDLLIFFLEKIGIDTKIVKASDYNFKGKKSDLVLDMCLKLNFNKYIFGEQGRNYVKEDDFKIKGVKIAHQKYIHPKYSQGYSNFIPNLSVLDLIFNYGNKSLEILNNSQNKFIFN